MQAFAIWSIYILLIILACCIGKKSVSLNLWIQKTREITFFSIKAIFEKPVYFFFGFLGFFVIKHIYVLLLSFMQKLN